MRERARTGEPRGDDFEDGLFDDTGHWRAKPKEWATAAPDADATRAEFWEVVRA